MYLVIAPYFEVRASLPDEGRQILAQFDDHSIVVYQAYSTAVGHYAAQHQRFERGFSFGRMSWIKPSFLWMMHRSGWGTKPGQEVVLALTVRRAFFESLLQRAVPSTFDPDRYPSRDDWRNALKWSDVRVQWDPDYNARDVRLKRRAIQLGLKDEALAGWDGRELLRVDDISPFVAEQRGFVRRSRLDLLQVPVERVYPLSAGWCRARMSAK